ncbi:acyl-CoA dehydrogenase [Burkholderia multivorans]|uniref:acyl-CoA dehydrogenase n=1 Tax=Burkholderia multivorans TaxID=87883 RepID=UPI001C2285E4|nr:acyl-CoA dehydrogenase [Burkholderia multivorans]MBU9477686.1 acyl-CoA dehydrogenase [Burkholderia multivorans]
MTSSSTLPTVSRRDLDFQLFEMLDVESLVSRPEYADHDRETFEAVLDVAQAIASEKFQTHYGLSDAKEPMLVDGKVVLIPEIKEALDAFIEAGFMSANQPYEDGGQQLPFTVYQACLSVFQAANIGTTAYYFLTAAAAEVIKSFGTADLKERFAKPMLEGRYFGTMCLSEPHAGSGLGDIRTRATPMGDGRYSLKGSKMWISAGDHALSENIVHLVLAKIDGAPSGVAGISLFAVPKVRVGDDGELLEHNDVQVVGLNHKMGYRSSVNTLLNFGEHDDCFGYLVGEAHRGLQYMFMMMNEARISVGVGATMLGYAGYLYSSDYARNRPQGRSPDNRNPDQPPIPIIEHADVKRMLLAQKAAAEGALALCLYAARLVDERNTSSDESTREDAELLLQLLTPIVKAWPAEYCLEANKHAIQVLGGYGYTRDYPVEQFYRDNRLNLIHEGTNGIQAIDLLGRKVRMQNGRAFKLLQEAIHKDISAYESVADVRPYVEKLARSLDEVVKTTEQMQTAARDGEMSLYLANASIYADALGHVVIAWMWLRQAAVAALALQNSPGPDDERFYRGKLAACRYFYAYELPRLSHWLPLLASLESTTIDTAPDWL